jgi:hypothetical protein
MEVPDARAAVAALKAVLGETSKQTDIGSIPLDLLFLFLFFGYLFLSLVYSRDDCNEY